MIRIEDSLLVKQYTKKRNRTVVLAVAIQLTVLGILGAALALVQVIL